MSNESAVISKWSTEQHAIFAHIETAQEAIGASIEHFIVRARAGTGKTTTLIELVKRLDPSLKILICAFSKAIQTELEARIGRDHQNITAKTLHAVGLSCVTRFRDKIKISFNGDRADKLADTVCGRTAPDAIKRLVSKLHTKGREIAPHATKLGELTEIAITFECEPDEQWTAAGFTAEYVETKALEAMELASNVQSGETIDGSDMIFLPVRNGWLTKQYDGVLVDEAQDMTPAQLEIAQGVCRGFIGIIGDDKQAIFAFRGADSDSLDRLKRELNAKEYGLKMTYRCGKNIVALAKTLVPDFTCGAEHDGEVLSLDISKLTAEAGPGDFILSRVNAPLVSIAMQLLRAGKRTRIAGRDIGAGLLTLLRKFRARSVPDLLSKIESWNRKEVSRLELQLSKATNGRKTALTSKIETVQDQTEMLASLTDGAKSVTEVEERAEALFTDDGLGTAGMITCSSVHRSKGLEANRVFVLRDTLRDNNQEELNIAYVAYTRAKNTLVLVTKKRAA